MLKELETPEDGSMRDGRTAVEQRARLPSYPLGSPPGHPEHQTRDGPDVFLRVGVLRLRDLLDNTTKVKENLAVATAAGVARAISLHKQRGEGESIHFEHDDRTTAESYREIRTNFHFLLSVDNALRVMPVASSVQADGNSSTAINVMATVSGAKKQRRLWRG